MNESAEISAAKHVKELLDLWDEQFVDAAYWTLLGRAPDPTGRAHHLYSIRSGLRKLDLLRRIRESEEGQEVNAKVSGLDEALRKDEKSKNSLWRRLKDRTRGKSFEARERAKRALANQLARGPITVPDTASIAAAATANPPDLAVPVAQALAESEVLRDLRRRLVRMETIINRLDLAQRKQGRDQLRRTRNG